MQYMIALGFRSTFSETFYGYRPGMATPGQVSLIGQPRGEYTEGQGNDASLGK